MGTWGAAIFSDDLASDVRSEFRDHVGDGLDVEEATRAMERSYADALDDPDDATGFWVALALTQHRLGRPMPRVIERALALIDGGGDSHRWEDSKGKAQRAAALGRARAELFSTPPAPKRVSKRFRDDNRWAVGQVVAYRLRSGAWCALHVVRHHEDRGGRSPVVRVLNWTGEALPTVNEIAGVGHRGIPSPNRPEQAMLGATSRRQIPNDRLAPLPIALGVEGDLRGSTVLLWPMLDGYLERDHGLV